MKEQPAGKAKKPNLLLRLLALLATAALVAGALLLVVYRDRLNLDALDRWLTFRSLETSSTGEAAPFTHAGGDDLSFACLENGILTASSSGARYYSFSGSIYAEEVTAMEHPVLSASDRSGVVYDAGGRSLFLFRGTEEVFDLSLEGGGDLLSARVNDAGWLAVTAQQSGYKGAVTVYDADGAQVIRISLSSTFVVDAALSPDCRTVAVVTIGQEGGAFSSQVLFYPVDQEEPSARADLGGAAVLDLDYEDGRLWVLGEDRLIVVPQDGGEPASYSFGRLALKGCALGGDGFALLLLGRYPSGPADRAVTVGPDGAELAAQNLTGQVLGFDAAGSYCSLLTGDALTVSTAYLEEYARLSPVQGARHTALMSNGSSLLADGQQAWLYIPG